MRTLLAALLLAGPLALAVPAATPAYAATCPSGATCDDFESQTGTTPGGAWAVETPNCSGTGTATVDTAQAHSGTRSIKVTGGLYYCDHVFVGRALPAGTAYFRFYLRHSTALPTNHATMVAMRDANDTNHDLRFGAQNGALQWNRESDDATLPEQSPTGVAASVPLPLNAWECVEYEVSGGQIHTWLNGTEITGLVEDGVPTPDIDRQWLSRSGWNPSLTDLRLGWESYAGNTDTLWYDDVAFGPTRIGC